jgi:RNA polymerase sigma factor FliA
MTMTCDREISIEAHLPLVHQIVRHMSTNLPRNVDRDELMRAGELGLVEAAQRFDADRGVPFERYVARRIEGAVLDALRACDWAPRSVRAKARAVEAATAVLTQTLGRRPSITELSSTLGMGERELADLLGRVHRAVVLTLDQPVVTDDGDDASMLDVLRDRTAAEPDELLEARELRAYVMDAVELLPARQRFVVEAYFLQGLTSEEIAEVLGVTESRVSQIRTEALQMLRSGLDAQFTPSRTNERHQSVRREAAFASAIAHRSTMRQRLDRTRATTDERAVRSA